MKAVTAGDHVAVESMLVALVQVRDVRRVALEVVDGDVVDLEVERQPCVEPRGDQILDDLGLPVDHDSPPPGQLAQREMVALAGELQVDAVVRDALARKPLPHACTFEHVDRRLLEHSGADPVLDVVAAPVLEHDRLDSATVKQLRKRQPGRPGTDDRDLRAVARHVSLSPASTAAATAKAWFAAGTPQ